jgi:CRP-like cAMP-binding protein
MNSWSCYLNLEAPMAVHQAPVTTGRNKLLAALPRREAARLVPYLEPISLDFEETLYEPDGLIRHVYFPMSSVISLLLVLDDGSAAEVGRVGDEGMVGLPVFLGVQRSHTRAFVQIPGEALRMKAQVFRRQAHQGGPLVSLLLRYTQVLLRHSERLTACNTWHPIEQRLSRWLLITHDRVQADHCEVTQEFLSQMLGVHRQSVTAAASNLQRAGLIRYSRGKLKILDRRGLEAASCQCYRAVSAAVSWLQDEEDAT